MGRALDCANRSFRTSVEAYRALASRHIGTAGLRAYVKDVFRLSDQELRKSRVLRAIEERHETGLGMDHPGVRGTLWGAYNAVTEWTGGVRGKEEGKRLESLWFGEGKAICDRALRVALEAAH